jgi:hypothetical protein
VVARKKGSSQEFSATPGDGHERCRPGLDGAIAAATPPESDKTQAQAKAIFNFSTPRSPAQQTPMTPTTITGQTDPLIASRLPYATNRVATGITGDHGSAVSWAAIFAGAAGAAALSLILLVLGVGLGLSSVSPWSSQGASAGAFGTGAIVWILFVALIASGTGGYLAGRLRSKWVEAHTDEVYFRDTAHGFLAWAIATLVTAALLTSTIGSILGTGAQVGGSVLGAAGSAATGMAAGGVGAVAGQARGENMPSGLSYFTDSLFRPLAAAAGASAPAGAARTDTSNTAASTSEAGRIFATSLRGGSMSADDTRYLGQLVAQRTGMSQQEAEKRVSDTYAKAQASLQDSEVKAKDAADKARKAGTYAALWMFVSLLLGAFTASLMATFGGRQRDYWEPA